MPRDRDESRVRLMTDGFPSDSDAEPPAHARVAIATTASTGGGLFASPYVRAVVCLTLLVAVALVVTLSAAAPDAGSGLPDDDKGGGDLVAPTSPPTPSAAVKSQKHCPIRKGRCGPTVFLAGAQKGGTSSLFEFLAQHPDFVSPTYGTSAPGESPKELQYYDHENHYSNGMDWYMDRFSRQVNRMTGDGTPDYLWYPLAFPRMYEDWPDAKIILSLRDPVYRTYSNYKMSVFFYEKDVIPIAKPDTFEEEIHKDLLMMKRTHHVEFQNSDIIEAFHDRTLQMGSLDQKKLLQGNRQIFYLERGMYAQQIKLVFETYPRDQIKIVQFEKLVDERYTQDILRDVCDFLGLDSNVDLVLPHVLDINEYVDIPPMTDEMRDSLAAFFKPHNEELFEILGYRYEEWL